MQILTVLDAAAPSSPQLFRNINETATWILLMSIQSTAFTALREDQMAWNAVLTAWILVRRSDDAPKAIFYNEMRES